MGSRRLRRALLLLACLLQPLPLFALAGPHLFVDGKVPKLHKEWPDGLDRVLSDESLIGGGFVNADDWFAYTGRTWQANDFFRSLARLEGTPITVRVCSRRPVSIREWHSQELKTNDWTVHVRNRRWSGTPDENGHLPDLGYRVVVEVFLGDQIDLTRLRVPRRFQVEAGSDDERIQRFAARHQRGEATWFRLALWGVAIGLLAVVLRSWRPFKK